MAQAPRRRQKQIGWAGCSDTATATAIIGTIGIIGTAGTGGADIDTDTDTDTSPDAGCIDFTSRSASAFG